MLDTSDIARKKAADAAEPADTKEPASQAANGLSAGSKAVETMDARPITSDGPALEARSQLDAPSQLEARGPVEARSAGPGSPAGAPVDHLAHAPKDHPRVKAAKIGVALANLGTPDGTDYWSMRRYLNQFLSDKRVIELPTAVWQPILQLMVLTKRPFASGAAYREVWNTERDEGPLLTTTRAQAEKLAARAGDAWGERVMVDFCMRYGNPSTESVLEGLRAAGCERILFLPLYPQYAAATTATANDHAFRALMKMRWQPAIRTAPAYHDHPLYIQALARSVEQAVAERGSTPEVLVASYHGLPKSYFMKGDPYHCHCQKTSRLLTETLGWPRERVVTTFQSRFGPEEWLQPYTVDEVARLAKDGRKSIAVIAPGFSADCLETLEEINGEIREAFIEAGGEDFTYIPCLNDDDAHIDLIFDMVGRELSGWL